MSASANKLVKMAGVMGWPVTHSLSPRVHGFWLKEYGIEGSYVCLSVEPQHFLIKIKSLKKDGFVGVNITVPHKESALLAVDNVDPLAQRIGAVNTIVVQPDGTLLGQNTDGFGFIENLKQYAPLFNFKAGPAVVLGAGGAARSVIVSLLDAGVPKVYLLNRTKDRADALAKDLADIGLHNIDVKDWENRTNHLSNAALLVNTTTLGMAGQRVLDLDLSALPVSTLVTDIVYTPLETDLLARARQRGNPVVDGLGMLLHQARPGFEAWFGHPAEVSEALRSYVLSSCDPAEHP